MQATADLLARYAHIRAIVRPVRQIVTARRLAGRVIYKGPIGPHKPALSRCRFRRIVSVVSANTGIPASDIVGPRRLVPLIMPRHLVCYMARRITRLSSPQIGRKMGGRDHKTILYAIDKVERMASADPDLRARIETLIAVVEGSQ